TRLVHPFASVFGDPMLRNGYALIVSAAVTQVLGFFYWIVAARTAPVAVVGRNSTAISVMLFLAGVAELNLMSTLVRFLPTSGKRPARRSPSPPRSRSRRPGAADTAGSSAGRRKSRSRGPSASPGSGS